MKKTSLLKKVLFSSFSFAVIPTVIIMFFLDPFSSQYKIVLDEENRNNIFDYYVDLNSDSISEIIRPGKGIPFYNILILNNNLQVYNQWNFTDTIDPDISDFFTGDYDDDLKKEIYIFSYRNDSIFLNMNEFFEDDEEREERFFITRVSLVNNKITSCVFPGGFYDINNDGFKELYFSIATGFALRPRLLYYFDIKHNILKSSAVSGTNFHKPQLVDVDKDGKPEIYGFVHSSDNNKTPVPYTDKSAWFMVYDENLNFKFPPVGFPGITNSVLTYPYSNDNMSGFIISCTTESADTSLLKPGVILFSTDGKKIRENTFRNLGFRKSPQLIVSSNGSRNRIYLLGEKLLEINDELEELKVAKSPFSTSFSVYPEDVDFDGKEEFILYSADEELLAICNSELKILAVSSLAMGQMPVKISHYASVDNQEKLYLSTPLNSCFLRLERNKLFWMGFLAYPLIFLFSVLFVEMVKRITAFQIVQREHLKQRLVTLQLQAVKAQLDPHFTFSTITAIASLIYSEDKKKAYEYITKFTHLLRAMINDAERAYRSLGEEVEFVKAYLDIEKLRFGEKLEYNIIIDDGISIK